MTAPVSGARQRLAEKVMDELPHSGGCVAHGGTCLCAVARAKRALAIADALLPVVESLAGERAAEQGARWISALGILAARYDMRWFAIELSKAAPLGLGRAEEWPCHLRSSCEPNDHTYSWPCDYAPGTGRLAAAAADPPAPSAGQDAIDVEHLERQRRWSRETFGPGPRTKGVLDHIRKELVEIEEAGERTPEWFDVVILALDGAWRDGFEPAEIIAEIKAKQARNEARTWPDWRTADPDKAIEHDRSHDECRLHWPDGYETVCGSCGRPL